MSETIIILKEMECNSSDAFFYVPVEKRNVSRCFAAENGGICG